MSSVKIIVMVRISEWKTAFNFVVWNKQQKMNIWKIKKTMTLIYGFCKSEIMNNVEYKIKIAIKVLKWEKQSENILEEYWIQIRASAI